MAHAGAEVGAHARWSSHTGVDDLATVSILVESALKGEVIGVHDPLPADPGDASLAGLRTGWAVKTASIKLERAEYWVTNPPTAGNLPLRNAYAPALYDFLFDRVRLEFPYLGGERHALVPAGLLQDAGFIAVLERRQRARKPQPARLQLQLLVRGLRAKYRSVGQCDSEQPPSVAASPSQHR